MNNILAMILAGGASEDLPVLTAHRSKAALPYGGRYRIIDFCLSNCTNSGIRRVGVLAQYNPASLIAHVGNGRPWDLDTRTGGLMVLQPYTARSESNWFRGTADALRQHLDVIEETPCQDVLLLSADQVYRMDYAALIGFHRECGTVATLAAKPRREHFPGRCGGLEIGEDKIVERFVEKPEHEQLSFLSLGIYAFRKDALIESLAGADQTRHDIVFDILMPLIAESQVRAYIFDDYWADVGWLSQYYDASMVLLMRPPPLNLGSRTMPIYTRTETRPPTLAGKNAEIGRCLIANGCTIEGAVSGSILFPGVKLKSGSVVEDSIIFADTVIEQDATVRSSIIDREARIGREAFVGFGNPTCPNSTYPSVVDSGLTIVGKRTQIPEGIRIGRNCLIGNHLAAETIPNRDIVCGETITGETKWQKTLS